MRFNSIAVLDLETTSLFRPKITELAVVACSREHCGNAGEIPRVLHKFSVCVNPCMKIHPYTSELTGLDNEMLANVNSFDDQVVESLRLFLQRLPQPTVLVAHNGLRFDFPLLKKEILMGNCAMLDVYCADSLAAFRTILTQSKPQKSHPELEDEEGDDLCMMAIEQLESPLKTSQESNEATPDRQRNVFLLAPKKESSQRLFVGNETARRALFPIPDENNFKRTVTHYLDDSDRKTEFSFRGKPNSFKLQDVFEYLHGYRPHDAHRAENDVLILLQCILKIPDTFWNFIDTNAVLLKNI